MVQLSGELTLQAIGDAHRDLLEAARSAAAMLIRVPADATVDLAGVQLLDAARRSARSDLTVALAEPAEGGLLETLRRGGFLQTADQRRFWLKEEVL